MLRVADEDGGGKRFGSERVNALPETKEKKKKKKIFEKQKSACPVTKHELFVVSHF